jgi:RNA polymerase sigma-70 factor, ECF subfamily
LLRRAVNNFISMSASEDREDLELVRRFKAGDERAFEELVGRYSGRIYSAVFGVLQSPEDAEEATQDVFWRIYRKVGTFDERRRFFSWAYRIALNRAYSIARSRRARPTISLDDHLPQFREDGRLVTAGADFSEQLENRITARELAVKALGFMGELPRQYRSILWMHDVERMSKEEIAEILDLSIPALKSRLHRARIYVRERLVGLAETPMAAGSVAS